MASLIKEQHEGYKNINYKAILLLFLCIFAQDLALANSKQINDRFQHLSKLDGLSQSYVYTIEQDPKGYMWFGTQEGLNRYDGYEFKTFYHDPEDQSSLPNNTIRSLLIDDTGTLWIGTDGGLAQYHPDTESFTNFAHQADIDTSLSTNRIRILFEDSKSRLWIGTDGAGLNLLDKETQLFDRNPTALNNILNHRIWAIHESSDGLIWIGTENGLVNIQLDTLTTTVFTHDELDLDSLSGNHVRAILEDNTGSLWVGTHNSGLNRYDANSEKFVRFQAQGNDGSISGNRITSIFQSASGKLWIATLNGLNIWKPKTQSFERVLENRNEIMSIYQDRGNLIWIGSYQGLSRWNPANEVMLHYEVADGLSDNTITSFAEDAAGKIWIGTFGGGLNLYDPETASFEQIIQHPKEPNSVPEDRVMALEFGKKDTLWIATRSNGLTKLEIVDSDKRFTTYKHDDNIADSLSANGVTSILYDSNADLWVGTYGGGLNKFDSKQTTFKHFKLNPNELNSLSSDRILALYQCSDDLIWIGTDGGGLNSLDPKTEAIKLYKHNSDDSLSLPSDSITMITEDVNGNLWIGTQGAGLALWRASDRRNGLYRTKIYSAQHGLPGNTIYGGEWDSQGDLWLSTGNGLTKFNIEREEFTTFGVVDGLQHTEFNHAASLRTSTGRLYFGGINGFNSFHPDQIKLNAHAPPSVITRVSKLNIPLSIAEIKDNHFTLGYADYVVAFNYAGLDFTAPDKNTFKYKLDGLDNDWIFAGQTHMATYTNLSPGEYQFKVKAANNKGLWSVEEATINFTVLAAPWFTWWAYTGYFLISITLAFFLLRGQYEKVRHARQIILMNETIESEITNRHKKEAELEHEKNLNRRYLEVAEVILLNLDKDGRVLAINNKGARILQESPKNIINQKWLDFVPDAHKGEVEKTISAFFGSTSQSNNEYLEYPILRADGSESLILWHSAASEDSLLASGMDVTELRNLERAVRLKEKMAVIGSLASGIAHDFNNILMAIYGYSVLCLEKVRGDDEVTEHLNRIVSASDRASSLIERLLSFVQKKETDLVACNLAPTIEEACDLLKGSLPSTILLTVDLQKDLPSVLADTTQIHQLVMNLCTNAGKAMQAQGGGLSVEAYARIFNAEELPPNSGLLSGMHFVLSISDSGIGIDTDSIDQIFTPFYSNTELGFGIQGQSTGLGLSIVHSIVTGHNGYIDVRSKLNLGSTFTVYLPCVSEIIVEAPADNISDNKSEGHIIVVDDEEFVRDVCKTMLSRMGYTVTDFDNAHDALKLLQSNIENVDLILTDETMPGMTGSELAGKVREFDKSTAIIIVSGHLQPFKETENTFFLRKPFSRDAIKKIVNQAMDSERNQTP
ncbi:MAG: response regulator [Pseudomonadales bacterium]|nr:response regulator [Pseudomonadales bacterium]